MISIVILFFISGLVSIVSMIFLPKYRNAVFISVEKKFPKYFREFMKSYEGSPKYLFGDALPVDLFWDHPEMKENKEVKQALQEYNMARTIFFSIMGILCLIILIKSLNNF